ncbi:MAG: YtxH domain-containing protein [Bacteroidota bacterium]
MENTNSSGKTLLALLGGVAIGALLGILLAPDKGSETRRKMADKARKTGERVRDKVRETILGDEEEFEDIA